MNRIAVGNNLIIEMDDARWRLLVNGNEDERVLLEAAAGQPLKYMPTFASKRRLPDNGALPTEYIDQIVLGWSPKDSSWQLGLVLEQVIAEARGSRWCALAKWQHVDPQQFQGVATQAGEALAAALDRPFSIVPPAAPVGSAGATPDPQPIPAPAPAMMPVASAVPATPTQPTTVDIPVAAPRPAPAALPALPVALELWTFGKLDEFTYEFNLSGSWARGKILRVFWYLLWAVVYIVLSIGSLRGGIAPPTIQIQDVILPPEVLPALGLVSAALLLLFDLNIIRQLSITPNRVIVDMRNQSVVFMRGRRQKRVLPAHEIDAVYVSHIVNRRGKPQKGRVIHYGELNLYLRTGKFQHVLTVSQFDDRMPGADELLRDDSLMPLIPESVYSDLQVAGLYVAQALNLPGWYDQRVK